MLQVDENLIDALHEENFVAIETNGTILCTKSIDWICVSPKNNTKLLQMTNSDELKLVYPQENAKPEKFESLNFQHFYLQPLDGIDKERHTRDAINFIQAKPTMELIYSSS